MELRRVKLQANQFKIHSGKDLNYEEYCSLLLSAAQHYDAQSGSDGLKMVKRWVYKHEFLDFDRPDIPDISDDYHNIDLPVASLQINATKIQNEPHLSYEQ